MSSPPLPAVLARLIPNAPLPVVVTDREGLVTFWAESAERAFGWTAEEVVGGRDPTILPEQRRQCDEARQRARDGDAQFFETIRQPRVGEPYDVRVGVIGVPGQQVHSFVTVCLEDLVATRRARERAEAAALRERTFSLLIEQLPGLIWSVDRDMIVTSLGGGSVEAVGLDPRQAVGQHLSKFIPLTEHPAGAAAAAAVKGERTTFECTFGGRLFHARSEPLRRGGEIIGAITVGLDVTEIRGAEEALNVSREELRRVSGSMNRVQENERRRIAREIHDELGQYLTGLRIDTSLLRGALPHDIGTAAEQRLDGFAALIDEALATVRRIATELRPALLDEFGFRAAVEGEISTFRRRTGVVTDLAYDLDERELGPETALALYRIVQESLTNVARHSGATQVRIRIGRVDERVELEIVDNGRGIVTTDTGASPSAGLGIAGVRERAYALGGDVVIEPAAGGGTRVFVSVPLDDLFPE